MKRIVLGFAAACALSAPAVADTIFLSGTVGKAPVFVSLNRDKGEVIGSYLYTKYGKQIELVGKIDASGAFHMDESNFDTAKKSGNFDGHAVNGVWSGTWTDPKGGAPLPISLTEYRNGMAGFSGDFKCSEYHTDKKYGYTYDRSAHVTLINGKVTRLDLTQESKGQDGDSQGCYIGLKDLKQLSGGPGVLLRGDGDDPAQKDTEHCTIHVVGNANFVYVSPGDVTEDHNDCKGAADVMFCSPRANFGDFLIDKSGMCKPND